jgi:hypothetical protein
MLVEEATEGGGLNVMLVEEAAEVEGWKSCW